MKSKYFDSPYYPNLNPDKTPDILDEFYYLPSIIKKITNDIFEFPEMKKIIDDMKIQDKIYIRYLNELLEYRYYYYFPGRYVLGFNEMIDKFYDCDGMIHIFIGKHGQDVYYNPNDKLIYVDKDPLPEGTTIIDSFNIKD